MTRPGTVRVPASALSSLPGLTQEQTLVLRYAHAAEQQHVKRTNETLPVSDVDIAALLWPGQWGPLQWDLIDDAERVARALEDAGYLVWHTGLDPRPGSVPAWINQRLRREVWRITPSGVDIILGRKHS